MHFSLNEINALFSNTFYSFRHNLQSCLFRLLRISLSLVKDLEAQSPYQTYDTYFHILTTMQIVTNEKLKKLLYGGQTSNCSF